MNEKLNTSNILDLNNIKSSEEILSRLDKVRSSVFTKVSDFIEKEEYAKASESAREIEEMYDKVIETITKSQKFRDLYPFIPIMKETSGYWKEKAERYKKEYSKIKIEKLRNEGLAFQNQQLYDKALTSFDQALSIDLPEEKPWILADKGNIYFDLGEFEKSIKLYNMALELNPNISGALTNKGLALSNMAQYPEAIEYFDKAHKIDPLNIDILLSKSIALSNLKRYHDALEWYDRALKIDPNNFIAIYNKALILFNLGSDIEDEDDTSKDIAKKYYVESIKYCDQGLEDKPNDVDTLMLKGINYFNMKKYDDALEWYDRALKIDPNNFIAIYNKGLIACEKGNYRESEEYYKKAININPDDVDSYLVLAEVLMLQDKSEQSETTARRVLEKTTNPIYVFIMRFIIICSLYNRDINKQGDDDSFDLLKYYESIPSDYKLDWNFDAIKMFIQDNNKISNTRKETLFLLMNVIERKEKVTEATNKLRSLTNEESLIKRALTFLGQKTAAESNKDIDFRIASISSPDENHPGWYKWEIFLNEVKDKLSHVESVTYILHSSFKDPERQITNRDDQFRLKSRGWGSFRVKVMIKTREGNTITKYHFLNLVMPLSES